MDQRQVVERIQLAVPEASDIKVEGADCDFTVLILSDSFDGVSLVKRQQMVLARFSDELATGELHALTVKAHTPSEWQARKGNTLAQISL